MTRPPLKPVPKPTSAPAKAGSYMKNGKAYYIGTNKLLSAKDQQRIKAGQRVQTYKGPDGKYRWVGSGALVHPDTLKAIQAGKTKAAPNPVTKPQPKPKTALDREVEAAISAQIAPYQHRLGELQRGFAENQRNAIGLTNSLVDDAGQLGQQSVQASAEMQAAVQAAQQRYQEEMARAGSFLQSMLGIAPDEMAHLYEQNMRWATAPTTFENAAEAGRHAFDQEAERAASQRRQEAYAQQGAEWQNEARQAEGAAQRLMHAEIARVKAQEPLLRRQFAQENFERRTTTQTIQLQLAQLREERRQFDANLAFQRQQGALTRQQELAMERERARLQREQSQLEASLRQSLQGDVHEHEKEMARVGAGSGGGSKTGKQDAAWGKYVENRNAAIAELRNLGALASSPDPQEAVAVLRTLGIAPKNYKLIPEKRGGAVVGHRVQLTWAGAFQFFRSRGFTPNQAYLAVQAYDAQLGKPPAGFGWDFRQGKMVRLPPKPTKPGSA